MTVDFPHQDWRDCSFRGKDLRQISFELADVRGCDFRGAQLAGATFKNAKLGRTRRQMIVVAIAVMAMVILAFHAFSHMFFGGLGTIRDDPAWGYVLALQISLALAGGMTGLQACSYPLWQRLGQTPSGYFHWFRVGTAMIGVMASCALIGFFYGGDLSGNNPQVAIATSVVLGIVGLAIGKGLGPRWLLAGLTLVGAIAAYGFFLTSGTNASSLFYGQRYALSFLWLGVSALYLKWTLDAFMFAIRRINAAMSTCFDPF
ncbi:MAG: pentapeptide repeat-containing protein [Cyanobacteria bacterium P01_F01_bin.150]